MRKFLGAGMVARPRDPCPFDFDYCYFCSSDGGWWFWIIPFIRSFIQRCEGKSHVSPPLSLSSTFFFLLSIRLPKKGSFPDGGHGPPPFSLPHSFNLNGQYPLASLPPSSACLSSIDHSSLCGISKIIIKKNISRSSNFQTSLFPALLPFSSNHLVIPNCRAAPQPPPNHSSFPYFFNAAFFSKLKKIGCFKNYHFSNFKKKSDISLGVLIFLTKILNKQKSYQDS